MVSRQPALAKDKSFLAEESRQARAANGGERFTGHVQSATALCEPPPVFPSGLPPPAASSPHLHGDHALLAVERGQEILLGQEVQGKLDQVAPHLLQVVPGQDGALRGQALLADVMVQVPPGLDGVGGEAGEDLAERRNCGEKENKMPNINNDFYLYFL